MINPPEINKPFDEIFKLNQISDAFHLEIEMVITRSQTKSERLEKKKLDEENNKRMKESRELQKNAVVEENPSQSEAYKWRKIHKKLLDVCNSDPNNRYRPPWGPIMIFLDINVEIQLLGDPWSLSKEGYSPSSFSYEIPFEFYKCLNAWRKWRGNVPRPGSKK
jgi:hypothetical protein